MTGLIILTATLLAAWAYRVILDTADMLFPMIQTDESDEI